MTDQKQAAPFADGTDRQCPGDYIPTLESLLRAAREDDEVMFSALLDDLTAVREQALFREVGRLTRQLHEALTSFQLDARVSDLASEEFPDGGQRLDQVIAITEQSAHRTMDLVEDMLPRANALLTRADSLESTLAGSSGNALPSSAELLTFVRDTSEQVGAIRTGLSEVIISQNFQDLSGQEIRKVIRLVKEVEETLINMIRVAGKSGMLASRQRTASESSPSENEQRVTSQDEADELLSSLGF